MSDTDENRDGTAAPAIAEIMDQPRRFNIRPRPRPRPEGIDPEPPQINEQPQVTRVAMPGFSAVLPENMPPIPELNHTTGGPQRIRSPEQGSVRGSYRTTASTSTINLPADDIIDEEIDAAANEGRRASLDRVHQMQQERLNAQRANDPYAHLSNRVPDPLPEDPKARAQAIAATGDLIGKEEFQHRMMHRLYRRNFPTTSIAHAMGVSTRQCARLLDKLKARYFDEATNLSTNDYLGANLWDYAENYAFAQRLAGDTSLPLRDRAIYLSLALKTMMDRHRLLDRAGLFKMQPLQLAMRPGEKSEQQQIDGALSMLAYIIKLAGDEDIGDAGSDAPIIEGEYEPPTRAPDPASSYGSGQEHEVDGGFRSGQMSENVPNPQGLGTASLNNTTAGSDFVSNFSANNFGAGEDTFFDDYPGDLGEADVPL